MSFDYYKNVYPASYIQDMYVDQFNKYCIENPLLFEVMDAFDKQVQETVVDLKKEFVFRFDMLDKNQIEIFTNYLECMGYKVELCNCNIDSFSNQILVKF